ncbi:hypothetical protein [Leptospira mayottensis]|uniref:hypothetical protein n=1 Tax=Leptospira mayottensis TaxID=1137606 RepID=UPI000E35A85F|nr:hypothetical protein [Leptospira mayottensis]AXR69937.1 hypothetical protein DPV73_18035 [Leptospira mayottensis]
MFQKTRPGIPFIVGILKPVLKTSEYRSLLYELNSYKMLELVNYQRDVFVERLYFITNSLNDCNGFLLRFLRHALTTKG